MPIGTIIPPPMHPDEEPFVCVRINQFWIPYIIGLLRPAKFPEYWSGTLAENQNARRDVQNLIALFQELDPCAEGEGGTVTNCCVEIQIINRINVATGGMEQSSDGGVTWHPSPNSPVSVIVEPPPPVTSGVAGTKCDAATNAMAQIQGWIDHVSVAFDTAIALFDFALLVAAAILDAILLILSAGELSVVEAQIIAGIGAILSAVWNGGKTLFVDYWTPDVKDTILCQLYCHIGTDGSFDETQFQALRVGLSANLPPGLAKNLFLAWVGVTGKQGMNSMAASGATAEADCSDCSCGCDWATWDVWVAGGTLGSRSHGHITIGSTDGGDGWHYASVFSGDPTRCCCNVVISFTGSEGLAPIGENPCGSQQLDESTLDFSALGGSHNAFAFKKHEAFDITLISTDPCP